MAGPSGRAEHKLTLFISYSRSDMAFADRLVAALEAKGFKCLIDRRDLEYGEKWQQMLRDLIKEADTVVYVVSPRSVGSQWCRWELAEVTKLAKRLVPVVIDPVAPEILPPEIGTVHLMPLGADVAFDAQLDKLDTVLMTDRAWIMEHTRLAGLARRWDATGRGRDGLLVGSELGTAETWLTRPTKGHLALDPAVQAFVSEGRANAIKAARRRTRLATAVAVGALILSAVAGWQYWIAEGRRVEAVDARNVADAQRDQALVTQSLFLADQSRQALKSGDTELAALIALEALPDKKSDIVRPYVGEAELSLYNARLRSDGTRVLGGHESYVREVKFSFDGERAVSVGTDKVILWDGELKTPVAALAEKDVEHVVFTPKSTELLTISEKGLTLWDAKTGRLLCTVEGIPAGVHAENAAISPDGALLAVGLSDKSVGFWQLPSTKRIAISPAHTAMETGEKDIVIMGRPWLDFTTVHFSRDSKSVVSTGADLVAIVWDPLTGERKLTLTGHTGPLITAEFSPDGKRVATSARDGTARIWEAKTGALLQTFEHSSNSAVTRASFSADGTRLLTDGYGGPRVWLTAMSLGPLAKLDAGEASFTPDRRFIVAADYSSVSLYSESGKRIASSALNDSVTSVALVPGQILTGHRYDMATLWRLTGEAGGASVSPIRELPDVRKTNIAESDATKEVAAAPVAESNTTAVDEERERMARLDEAEEARELEKLGLPPDVLAALKSVSTGVAPPVTGETSIDEPWHALATDVPTSWELEYTDAPPKNNHRAVSHVEINPKKTVAVGTMPDGIWQIWPLALDPEQVVFHDHDDGVVALAFAAEPDAFLSREAYGAVRRWKVGESSSGLLLDRTDDTGDYPMLGPYNGRVITREKEVVDADSSKVGYRLAGAAPVKSYADMTEEEREEKRLDQFSADGSKILWWTADGALRVAEAGDGKPLSNCAAADSTHPKLATLSRNGRALLVMSADGTVVRCDPVTGQHEKLTSVPVAEATCCLAADDDGRAFAFGRTTGVGVWDLKRGLRMKSFDGVKGVMKLLVASADGLLAMQMRHAETQVQLRFWDLSQDEPDPPSSIATMDIAFNTKATRVAVASIDGALRIIDSKSRKVVQQSPDHGSWVNALAFSKDGNHIVTGSGRQSASQFWLSDENAIRYWRTYPSAEALVAETQARLQHCLTPGQRKQLFLPPDPPAWCTVLKKWPYDRAQAAPPAAAASAQ